MSRLALSEHRPGSLDLARMVKPKADQVRGKKYIIRSKPKGKKPGNAIDENELQYFFTVQYNLGKLKLKFKNRYVDDCAEVATALERYRMIITTPKDGPTHLEAKAAAEKNLKDTIKNCGALDMLVGSAMKKGFCEDGEKVMRDEMQAVMPCLYVGGWRPATNKSVLKTNKITHVVCCIDVSDPSRFPNDFKYLNVKADDRVDQDMIQYFDQTNKFIDECLKNGGSVYVHCGAGISRSATVVCAYLISALKMSTKQAVSLCQQARPFIKPNEGFMAQLKIFEKQTKGQ